MSTIRCATLVGPVCLAAELAAILWKRTNISLTIDYLAHEARSSSDENGFAFIQFLYRRQLLLGTHFD